MILGKVKKQMLQIEADPCVDGSRDYITGRFCFSDDWSGMQKYAHFQIGSQEPFSVQLDENGEWGRDAHVNLTTGEWYVWLHGTDGTTVITTNVVTCRVIASGTIDGDPFPEVTPSVGEQIIERAQKSATEAAASEESAKEYAEAAQRAATSFDRAHLKDVAISTDGNSATFTHEDGTTTTFKPKTGGGGGTVDWDDVQNKPEAFPPERHTHSYNELRDKPSIPEAYDDTEIRTEIEKVSDGLEAVSEELSTVSDGLGTVTDGLGKVSDRLSAVSEEVEEQSAEIATQSAEIATQAQLMPEAVPTVGKVLKVLSVNEDGTFTCEWADGGSTDVQINGTSITADGVANIPIADESTIGAARLENGYGVVNVNGRTALAVADESRITSRNARASSKYWGAIDPSNLDFAVRASLTDGNNQLTYSPEQKAAACERLGAEPKHKKFELIDDITLDTDQRFVRYTSASGDPYVFDAVFIDVDALENFTAWKEWMISSAANNTKAGKRIGRSYSMASHHRVQILCKNESGVWQMNVFGIDTEGKTTATPYGSFMVETSETDKIRNIYLDGLKADTRIKIYGIKA